MLGMQETERAFPLLPLLPLLHSPFVRRWAMEHKGRSDEEKMASLLNRLAVDPDFNELHLLNPTGPKLTQQFSSLETPDCQEGITEDVPADGESVATVY